MQMSNYRQLLLLSSKALSTYDPESSGVDTHLENFLHMPECNVSLMHTYTTRVYVYTTRVYVHTHNYNNYYASEESHVHVHTQVKDEADVTFISEVFSGCVCYQGLIKVLSGSHCSAVCCLSLVRYPDLKTCLHSTDSKVWHRHQCLYINSVQSSRFSCHVFGLIGMLMLNE